MTLDDVAKMYSKKKPSLIICISYLLFYLFLILVTGVKVVVIGIGDVNSGDLDDIAPPSSGDTAVTKINSTDDLNGLISILVTLITDVTGTDDLDSSIAHSQAPI